LQVYARRTIGTDDYVGGLKDTIETLFAKNGTNDPTLPIVVTRNLRKADKKGNSQELQAVIKFTVSSFETSHEATITQMNESVSQAKAAYEHIGPSPSVPAPARDAAGMTVNAIPLVTKAVAWEPLLEKVQLFTDIVDKFAEV
jgi:hypothetical protein